MFLFNSNTYAAIVCEHYKCHLKSCHSYTKNWHVYKIS